MAKKNWFGMLAVVLTFGMVLISCYGGNGGNGIANTKWEYRSPSPLMNTQDIVHTVSFGKNTCSFNNIAGTYTISGERIVMTLDNGNTCTGTLAGNSLTVYWEDIGLTFSRIN
jgi:hypothetical protein